MKKKLSSNIDNFIPLYERTKITDTLHDICGFRADFNFITKQKNENNRKNQQTPLITNTVQKKSSTVSRKRIYVDQKLFLHK